MHSSNRRTAERLSAIVALLMGLASASGLFSHELYRDNDLVASSWVGDDLVTFVVATPLFIGALVAARRGSTRATLVWLGMLVYSLYSYAFYLFGAAFNSLFLVYVLLYTLSAFALIFGLVDLDAGTLYDRVRPTLPRRWIAAFMFVVAAGLTAFYGTLSVQYAVTGQVPAMIDAVGLHTNLIAALDLTMVVPVGVLGGVWLWRDRPWGYVLAVLWTVKGAVYMLDLSAATASTVLVGPSNDWAQLGLWGPIGVGCLIAGVLLLAHLKPSEQSPVPGN